MTAPGRRSRPPYDGEVPPAATNRLVIRDAEVHGARADVVAAGGRIAAVTQRSDLHSGDEVLHGGGGALLPGLHDHHVHLLAGAAALGSIPVGPPQVSDRAGFVGALRRADAAAPEGAWLRAVGYHDSVAGPLDAAELDGIVSRRPVRVQHRSGAMWVLNTAALREVGPDAPDERDAHGRSTGRLVRADGWLRERIRSSPPDLAPLGRRLAELGVTGVTDLTPTDDAAELRLIADGVRSQSLPQRVTVTGGLALDPAVERDLPRGPVKLVVGDHRLPPLDELAEAIRTAHDRRRSVALHCVTREALVLAIVALRDAGVSGRDRIEHGAVIPVELLDDLVQLGLTVVTQPGFVRERGDRYLVDTDPADRSDLWRCGTLVTRGIPVAFGSDLPYADPDPWADVRTAVDRCTRRGAVLGVGERLSASAALAAWLGSAERPDRPRRVEPGAPADLVLVDRPLTELLAAPTAEAIVATIVAGRIVHQRR